MEACLYGLLCFMAGFMAALFVIKSEADKKKEDN